MKEQRHVSALETSTIGEETSQNKQCQKSLWAAARQVGSKTSVKSSPSSAPSGVGIQRLTPFLFPSTGGVISMPSVNSEDHWHEKCSAG